ncbi:MAG: penicillin-binding protein activator [Rickettsiales bacterium]|nr:penicillin-binding protein activator [Rickettsiales bacterium]
MKLKNLTICIILFFTTSCIDSTNEYNENKIIQLPPRIEKQIIKEKFSDLPFESKKEIKIAMLLPLTDKHAKIGKDLYNAAKLALYDHGDPRIVIYPIDTKGSSFGAISAAKEAIEKNVNIIIGPVFSANVKAIKPLAEENKLTIFTFSNDTNIAEENIYVLGLGVEQQVDRVVQYAKNQGYEYFASIAPANQYGSKIAFQLRESAGTSDKTLKTEFYNTEKDLDSNVRRVVKTLSESPVNEEGIAIFQEDITEQKLIYEEERGSISDNDILEEKDKFFRETRDIDDYKRAIVIGEGSTKLNDIAKILTKRNLSKDIKLLGLSVWDKNHYLNNPLYENSWYADYAKENIKIFESHFYENFDYDPPRISILAYDIVSVISALASYHDENDEFTLQAINNPVGFSGVSGVFRFREDGVVERLLEVYEVINHYGNSLDPAPFQFEVEENTKF